MAPITQISNVLPVVIGNSPKALDLSGAPGNLPALEVVRGASIGIACRKSENPKGVEIISILPGSTAAAAGLAGKDGYAHRLDHREPDVITAVHFSRNGKNVVAPVKDPSSLQKVLDQLSEGDKVSFDYICSRTHQKRTSGQATLNAARGVIGISIDEDFLDKAPRVNLQSYNDFPAARAGLKDGDLIEAIDIRHKDGRVVSVNGTQKVSFVVPGGNTVSCRAVTLDQYAKLTAQLRVGDTVTVHVLRQGDTRSEEYGGVLGFFTKSRNVTPYEEKSIKISTIKRPSDLGAGDITKL